MSNPNFKEQPQDVIDIESGIEVDINDEDIIVEAEGLVDITEE